MSVHLSLKKKTCRELYNWDILIFYEFGVMESDMELCSLLFFSHHKE